MGAQRKILSPVCCNNPPRGFTRPWNQLPAAQQLRPFPDCRPPHGAYRAKVDVKGHECRTQRPALQPNAERLDTSFAALTD